MKDQLKTSASLAMTLLDEVADSANFDGIAKAMESLTAEIIAAIDPAIVQNRVAQAVQNRAKPAAFGVKVV